MGELSKIEWTDHTFNPWWGCQRVSPGCVNCYAESTDARWNADDPHWGPTAPRKMMSAAHWRKPLKWDRAAAALGVRHRVFCASMADVFELLPIDHPSREDVLHARKQLWQLIRQTPNLDWLLLTKRPENFVILPWRMAGTSPWKNVWLGVTAENQEYAEKRIPILIANQAARKFVSYEPALEAVDFDPPDCQYGCSERLGREWHLVDGTAFCTHCDAEMGFGAWLDPLNGGIDWVIAGAESGPGARPMDEAWVRRARDQCQQAGTSFFYKQKIVGSMKIGLPALDGRSWAEVPASP